MNNWLTVLEDYKAYKKITPFPIDEQGKTSLRLAAPSIIFASIDYEWKNKLRFVRIYFDTPTFDRITMEKAAGPIVCNWRHHGSSHWVFRHQWS